jgi:hypothetical protein
MMRPKFRRSPVIVAGRPSPRAADLSPEQAQQIAEAGGKIAGAIADTLRPRPSGPPPPPPPKDNTPLILAGVAVVALVLFFRRR